MAVTVTRSAGMLLLAIWLILTGVAGFITLPLPSMLMAALALIAGVLILVGTLSPSRFVLRLTIPLRRAAPPAPAEACVQENPLS